MSDTYLKGLVYEFWLCKVDVELDALIRVFGIGEVSFVDEGRISLLADVHDGHPRDVHDALQVLRDGLADFGRFSHNFIINIDLVVDADAGCLPEALDTVRDFTAQTHALELRRQVDIEHDGALAL